MSSSPALQANHVNKVRPLLSKLDRNWEQHFFDIRSSFFATFGMIPTGAVLRDWILFDTPAVTWGHLPALFMTAIYSVGWASANRRAHAVLALAGLVVLITSTASVWFQPGAGRELLR